MSRQSGMTKPLDHVAGNLTLIYEWLNEQWEPVTTLQIAEQFGLKVKATSSKLCELHRMKMVTIVGNAGKFNLWVSL